MYGTPCYSLLALILNPMWTFGQRQRSSLSHERVSFCGEDGEDGDGFRVVGRELGSISRSSLDLLLGTHQSPWLSYSSIRKSPDRWIASLGWLDRVMAAPSGR